MQVYFELYLNVIQETDDAGKKKYNSASHPAWGKIN